MSFDLGFAMELLPTLLRGAVITLCATAGGMALALAGGLALAVGRMSRAWGLRTVSTAYVEFVRNTPFLIQLYVVFYVLPQVGLTAPALATGIIAIGLNYSAYTAEVYRSGIEGVDKGQWEAAVALDLSPMRTWTRIIIPQALRPTVPVLGNYLIGMFKETPLLSTITVIELFGAAQSVAGTTYRYTEPYTMVALIFLLLSLPSAYLVKRVDQRFNRD